MLGPANSRAVAPVLTAGQTLDGLPCFTMAFMKGDTLRTRGAVADYAPIWERNEMKASQEVRR